jgi:hypothetical protein
VPRAQDVWIGNDSLVVKYPSLYHIARKKKQILVVSVLKTTPLNISFRRALTEERLRLWLELTGMVLTASLKTKL